MDFFRILRDWGLGALVFLGWATQPASFSEPVPTPTGVLFRLQDAFPDEIGTLIEYGTEISIHFAVRIYSRSVSFLESTTKKTLRYDRRLRRAVFRVDQSEPSSYPLDQAKLWLSTLEVSVLPLGVTQVSVRAELSVSGRTSQEATGLWGGIPAATWRPAHP